MIPWGLLMLENSKQADLYDCFELLNSSPHFSCLFTFYLIVNVRYVKNNRTEVSQLISVYLCSCMYMEAFEK